MVVDDIRNNIEAAPYGTLLFNSSYPEYDEEYVGKVLSDLVLTLAQKVFTFSTTW